MRESPAIGLGTRILAARGKLSRKAFATKLNVHPNTLARYETGERPATIQVLDALLRVCPWLDAEWLTTGRGQMRRVATKPAPPTSIDPELISDVCAAVDEAIAWGGLEMASDKRGKLVAALYVRVASRGGKDAA